MALALKPDQWEALLRDEGMPAELRLLTERSNNDPDHRDGFQCVPMDSRYNCTDNWGERANVAAFGAPTSLGEMDQARYWARFGQAVAVAPIGRQTKFLVALADCGMVLEARRRSGMPASETAYRWLRLFAAWRRENGV